MICMYQKTIMRAGSMLLRRGGRMVYSTCTVNPYENESNVAFAVNQLGLKLVPAAPRVGGAGVPGYGLEGDALHLVQRFSPVGAGDTPGFFIAAFEKL
jgi:16S rRNA C967 or C1407 C5-methylase (RsmB/RsmF family)